MLTTYLNTTPYSKFILIEDNLDQRGKDVLKYIVDSHGKNSKRKIHYFAFEGNFQALRNRFPYCNIEFHDFNTDTRGWLDPNNKVDFECTILDLYKRDCFVVIDSLSHLICQYGLVTVYKIFQQLLCKSEGILQIVTILHQDLCENLQQTLQYFEHLSSFVLALEPGLPFTDGRIVYTYKKSSGKVLKNVEEYSFENGILKSQPIKKVDTKVLLQNSSIEAKPQKLTTFKIDLNETEKQSRDKLILPYIPIPIDNIPNVDSNISYQFDHTDDWDEEDPDDDLDI